MKRSLFQKHLLIIFCAIFSGSVFAQDIDQDGVQAAQDPDDNNPCVPYNSSSRCDDDGDGVPNAYDAEPNTPNGNAVTTNGITNGDCAFVPLRMILHL